MGSPPASLSRAQAKGVRRDEDRLELITKAANDAVYDWWIDEAEIWWNEGLRKVFGYERQETPPTFEWWQNNVHPEDRERVARGLHEALETKEDCWADKYRFRRSNGSYVVVMDRGFIIRDEEGHALRMVGGMTDVTSVEEAQTRRCALVELTERLRDLQSTEEIAGGAAEILGRTLGVARAGYGRVDPWEETVMVERDWTDGTVGSVRGVHSLKQYWKYFSEELKAGEIVSVANTAQDPRTMHTDCFADNQIGALITVPLIEEGRITAVVYVHDPEPREWKAEEMAFARELGERTWLAMDRKRAREVAERKTRRMQLLAETVGRLLSSNTPEQIVRGIFSSLAEELDVHLYLNFMANGEDRTVILDSWGGISEEEVREVKRLRFGDFVSGKVAEERRGRTISHVQESHEPETGFLRRMGVRAYASNPLIVGDLVLGTLSFGSKTRDEFGPDDVTFMRTICNFVALAQERALHEMELEQRVAERTSRLREIISELEAFSYSISHDMRGPLRAMQGFSVILCNQYKDRLGPEGAEYLDMIQRSALRLDRLIQDVLSYSQIARADVKLQMVDVSQLLRDILRHYPGMQPPDVQIEIEEPLPPVMAQPSYLTQVLSNLLGNAIKFVPPGRTPEICVSAQRQGNRVKIVFQDNGIGIEPKDRERIFNIFERVHDQESYEGTGIGLSIVRKAVERMGGTVGVESGRGQGSCFWIELIAA